MEKRKIGSLSRRMGERSESSRTVETLRMSPAELVTTIRRLGYVALRVHEVVMGRLTAQQDYELAERFNDLFKPLADLMVHFTLEGEDVVSRETIPEGE